MVGDEATVCNENGYLIKLLLLGNRSSIRNWTARVIRHISAAVLAQEIYKDIIVYAAARTGAISKWIGILQLVRNVLNGESGNSSNSQSENIENLSLDAGDNATLK